MTASDYQQLVELLERHVEAINRRFDAIDQRFEAIDRRFEAMDQRLEQGFREVLGHLEAIYRRLERLEQEYHAILQALRRIEAMLADERGRREMLEQGLADLKRQMATLQTRIEEIEHRLSE